MHILGKAAHTSPQNYTDLDGNTRSFTYVDHDKKTKISIPNSNTNPMEELKQYRKHLQEKILALPASACPDEPFSDFKVREGNAIVWNTAMINNEGTPISMLRDIYTLTSNKIELYGQGRLTL